MPLFNFFGFTNTETGSGDSNYDENDALLGLKKDLSYEECMDIYRYFPLGKRIARSLPNFALSAPRIVDFGDLPPFCNEEYERIEKDMHILSLVKDFATYTRIFGIAALYVACDDVDSTQALDYYALQNYRWRFNLQDPLNLNGIGISQDPLSEHYQKVVSMYVNGKPVSMSRCCVAFNDMSFYLKWVPSAYSFSSGSIYQNMVKLIKSWNRCVVALERMATKSSVIIFKNREGGAISGVAMNAAKKALNYIRDLQNDGAISIQREDSVEGFPLTGVEVVDKIVQNMNAIISMALNDTPSSILLDKELAQGFGNGSEDMKAILMAVDNFRDTHLTPIYTFIDKFLLYKMCNIDFFERLRQEAPALRQLSNTELLEKVVNSFSYQWGNLYPETEATRIDNMTKKLDNLARLKALGANQNDIETILNNDKTLYTEEITLDTPSDSDVTFGNTAPTPEAQALDTADELRQDRI